jgi:hypothetical protein
MYTGDDHGTVCWNTPYRKAYMDLVEKVIRDYDIDGLYFDRWIMGYFWPGRQVCGITLEKQHPRITEYGGSGRHLALLAAQFDFVRGGIVLHLLTGSEVVAAHWYHGRLPDAHAADRKRSAPDTITPLRWPPVLHGLARDSPCTC